MVLKECCSKCGFPLDMERDIVFIEDSIISYLEYEENKCEECGHQKDGITIKITKKTFDEAINQKIKERREVIKFLHHYNYLTEEQRKKVCIELPRFMRKSYKSKGNMEEGDLNEPYSWNVVFMEVINDTRLAKVMVRDIDWEKIKENESRTTKKNK